jgi:hypothetical protein
MDRTRGLHAGSAPLAICNKLCIGKCFAEGLQAYANHIFFNKKG